MKKKFFALMMAMLMVLSLAACGGKEDPPAPGTDAPAASGEAGGAFKLGGTGPLTGGAAIYGNAVKNGAQIAVDEINAMGGIQFELKYEDDTHDAEKAVNAYNVLKDWGMQISMGSVTSKPCEATSAETYADRIFALTPSASTTGTIEGKDNMFQMCFMDPNQGTASAQYISDKGLGTKIAVIWKNDDPYSKGIHDTFTAKAGELGLEVVSDTTFADGNDTDFSVQLKNAQDAGAALVLPPEYYRPASLVLSRADSMSYGVVLRTACSADSTDERTRNFVAEYQKRFGEVPNQFAADAYDCVYAYKQALEAAGATPDMSAEDLCAAMIEQFTSMTFDGLTGDGMTWDATGAVSKSPKGMVIENGAYVGLD